MESQSYPPNPHSLPYLEYAPPVCAWEGRGEERVHAHTTFKDGGVIGWCIRLIKTASPSLTEHRLCNKQINRLPRILICLPRYHSAVLTLCIAQYIIILYISSHSYSFSASHQRHSFLRSVNIFPTSFSSCCVLQPLKLTPLLFELCPSSLYSHSKASSSLLSSSTIPLSTFSLLTFFFYCALQKSISTPLHL